MAVVHLVRETHIPRDSLVVLNTVCRDYPGNEDLHIKLYHLARSYFIKGRHFGLVAVREVARAYVNNKL